MKKLTITSNIARDAELRYELNVHTLELIDCLAIGNEEENHLLQDVSSQVTTLVS